MSEKKYFDFHASGLGYVNRFREVSPKRGDTFYAVTLAAMHGAVDDPEYTYIDCTISGSEALKRLRRLQLLINAQGAKVLIGFKIGDLYLTDPYETQSGTRQSIKGRLLKVLWAKVKGDGEATYRTVFKPRHGERAPSRQSRPLDVSFHGKAA